VPHHKSCIKRLKTAEKANQANRAVRSTIRTSLKVIRTAESKDIAEKEAPRLFSLMDKAAAKNKAGFNKNRVANYKRKVAALLNRFAA
jgi:small subunit ribosomal protein S20